MSDIGEVRNTMISPISGAKVTYDPFMRSLTPQQMIERGNLIFNMTINGDINDLNILEKAKRDFMNVLIDIDEKKTWQRIR